MRVTLVIHNLNAGGAERVMSTMANYWAAKSWSITLLTYQSYNPPFYDLHSGVNYLPLKPKGLSGLTNAIEKREISVNTAQLIIKAITRNFREILDIRRAIHQSRPQVVISFLDNTNTFTLLATRGLDVPVIISERIDPAMYHLGRFWDTLRLWTYPMADKLVVQSEAALNYFPSHIQKKSCIIPNPINWPHLQTNIGQTSNTNSDRVILSLGRLKKQKGFDLLLHAFAQVAPFHPNWSLEIWGEGPERPMLESLIGELGLRDRVRLPGLTKQPFNIMQKADLFVLSSRFEGFPNVLLEAMACGLPVISFDCPSGPREIIRDGLDGILIESENTEALASAMKNLMSNANQRQQLAVRAPDVLQRFSLEKIMEVWENLLEEVID